MPDREISIEVDRDTCDGFGNCVAAAQDIFALDDDGLVVLTQPTVSADRADDVRRTAYDCPTEAISHDAD